MSMIDDSDLKLLPGIITDVESDYENGYDSSQFGTTDPVLIIGTAFNGPVGKMVPVYTPEYGKYIFGGVYDSKTRKEATLYPNIKAAWDKGCRTIYAFRVSGKEIYKDFKLALDTKYKLRVKGIFPSNKNKDLAMLFDNSNGSLKIKIYKTADRATIEEKQQGLVQNDSSIIALTMDLSGDYGLRKSNSLTSLISVVNSLAYNNVLRLSIVDENGNEVQDTSVDAQALCIGDMFPGVYLIGRDSNVLANDACTETNFALTDLSDVANPKPYAKCANDMYVVLSKNTNVAEPYPIYADSLDVSTAKYTIPAMDIVLSIPEKIDEYFNKDSIDYEEVGINGFDLYEKLGSGFAITACVPDGKNVVIETPVDNPNRKVGIEDGMYSALENVEMKFRVLTCANFDDSIAPKKVTLNDFQVASSVRSLAFAKNVFADSVVDSEDLYMPKKYKFIYAPATSLDNRAVILQGLKKDKVIKRVSDLTVQTVDAIDKTVSVPNGVFVLCKGASDGKFALYQYIDNTPVPYTSKSGDIVMAGSSLYSSDGTVFTLITAVTADLKASDSTQYKYILGESNGSVIVYSLAATTTPSASVTVTPLGSLASIGATHVYISAEDNYFDENRITITSDKFARMTIDEFIRDLNADEHLVDMFSFSANLDVCKDMNALITALMGGGTTNVVDDAFANKTIAIDHNKYIPYATTDNFARQLAQHCIYTSIKTGTTYGFIGASKLINTNQLSVAKAAAKLQSMIVNDNKLQLYAKKSDGSNMLNKDNLPYDIGRAISATFIQYIVDVDGYNYVANGAAGYAGMVSVLPQGQAPTCQTFSVTDAPMFEFTNYELIELESAGIVTVKRSKTKGWIITDDVTLAPSTSSFRDFSTDLTIYSIEDSIRTALEPFLGKQNHQSSRDSIDTSIKSAVNPYIGTLLSNFTFTMQVASKNGMIGLIDVFYELTLYGEIKGIRNRMHVKGIQ